MPTPSRSEGIEQKRALWKQHIENWRSSGLTQKDFCLQHELKPHQFTYWKKRFVHTDAGITFVPLKFRRPLRPPSNTCSASIRVVVDRDLQIELGPDFDPRLLRRLITTLRSLP
mgnify:CR=1 FL=1